MALSYRNIVNQNGTGSRNDRKRKKHFVGGDGREVFNFDDPDKRRELNSLDREYDEKKLALLVWYENERKLIEQRRSHAIKLHAYPRNQYEFDGGARACAAISLIAVYNFLRLEGRNALEITWSKVIETGALLWKKWNRRRTGTTMYQHVYEAFNDPSIKRVRDTIEIASEISGHLDDERVEKCNEPVLPSDDLGQNVYCLTQAIQSMKTREREPSGATFTIRGYTVSILFDHKKFWLFDSHGGLKERHSTLVECNDENELYHYMRTKFPLYNGDNNRSANTFASDENTFSVTIFTNKRYDT